jgi:hypothetical protein
LSLTRSEVSFMLGSAQGVRIRQQVELHVTERPSSESDTAAEELRRTMHYDDG